MKLSEIKLNGEYAIVPSWTYSNQSARNVATVRENDVVKATVTSLDKYDYEPSNRKDDPANFRKAKQGERSVGILVKALDNNGKEYYWTSRLADVVAEWSVLEPQWNAKKAKEDEEQRLRNEQRKREEEIQRKAEEEVERSRNSITTTAKELLGAGSTVEVSTSGYGVERKAMVSISLREFEQLLELAYEGKVNA